MRLLLCFMLFIFGLPHAYAKSLVFAVEPFCPYSCTHLDTNQIDPDKPGIIVEIVQTTFETAGYSVEFKSMPFVRAVKEVREGSVHGMISMLKPDAPDLIFPKMEVGVAQACFVVRKGDLWRYQGVKSLHDKRFGGVAGYSYGVLETYLMNNPAYLITGDDALERNLVMLDQGRIDITLNDRIRINYVLAQTKQQEKFEFAGCIDQPLWIYVPFSPARPESKELSQLFDKGIAELRQTGRLKLILARYGLDDWH